MVRADICHDARPILIVTGDDDRVLPTKGSVRLAREIDAPVRVIEACRHLLQEECSGRILASRRRILEHYLDKV
jgi:pimeloyl-ACP methyl ester carboxylesterase